MNRQDAKVAMEKKVRNLLRNDINLKENRLGQKDR
ncbi:MAG: hypothetical protein QG599_3661 [Pseudomonadota bacterium]|nr:hypothetical protein [Pseudomonadota bacterium]